MRSNIIATLRRSVLFSAVVLAGLLPLDLAVVTADEKAFEKAVVDSPEVTNDQGSPLPKSVPLYSDDKPDWVAAPDVLDGNVHRVTFTTELLESEEACRAQVDKIILDAARQYVNQHVIDEPIAQKLSGLTASWVRENWLVPNREWVAVLERPSGTYHQLWGQLEIFPEDRQQVTAWYHDLEIRRRSLLCLFLSLSVGGLAGVTNMGLRFWKHRTRT
ncbi:MAG: hypothetical protein NTW52_03315 [Planctomycetota bacterium]|nr:hypothetical protein [Planctomycetota bacterium]